MNEWTIFINKMFFKRRSTIQKLWFTLYFPSINYRLTSTKKLQLIEVSANINSIYYPQNYEQFHQKLTFFAKSVNICIVSASLESTNFLKCPSAFINNKIGWSNSTIFPFSNTKIRSDSITLCNWWDIVSTVQAEKLCFIVFWIRLSVSGSTLAVASSLIKILLFRNVARAKEINCLWPMLRFKPPLTSL